MSVATAAASQQQKAIVNSPAINVQRTASGGIAAPLRSPTAMTVSRSAGAAGFAGPPKGFFAKDGPRTVSGGGGSSTVSTRDLQHSSAVVDEDAGMPLLASSVPARGRRRESIGAQMRKGASPSTAGVPPAGVPIAGAGTRARSPSQSFAARYSASAGTDLSRSFGTAASEVLGLSTDKPTSPTTALPIPATRKTRQTGGKSLGHSHFGEECFGPTSFDVSLPDVPPSKAALAQLKASSLGSADTALRRRDSADTIATVDSSVKAEKDLAYSVGMGADQLLHRCESCAKVYRHPSCLIKHRWEHTVYWKEASKFLLSKHQQVQLLEAAAILVGMDSEARSLPEEKALWPAAVSPPESGLLGSEVFNYERLMEGRRLRQSQSQSPAVRAVSPSMSPLNNLSQLHLESKPSGVPSSRDSRAGSAETVPEEDLMEDVTRSSTATSATRTTSSTGTQATSGSSSSQPTAADSPGRLTSESSASGSPRGADDDDEVDLDVEEHDRSAEYGQFDMDE